MSDGNQIEVRLGRGIVATVWRIRPGGKYRCCVTFPEGVQVSTVDFRFRTIADAHTWAKEQAALRAAWETP